jgi:hypothetical protein
LRNIVSTAKKGKHYIEPKPEDFEAVDKAEEETEDIYDAKQRERMLEEGEISVAEEGFMVGRDEPPSKKVTRKNTHDDSVSVELAKRDAEDR